MVLRALAMAAAAGMVGACGGGGGGPTSKELAAELLTLKDLPTGWSEQQAANASQGQSLCRISGSLRKDAIATAQRKFGHGILPAVDEFLAGYHRSPSATFDGLIGEIRACHSFGIPGFRFAVGHLQVPTIGTKSYAFSLSGEVRAVSGANVASARVASSVAIRFTFDIVMAEKGNQVLVLVYGATGTPPATEVTALATKAASRIPG
ncbi:hypothetical protein GHK86_12915 [Acidimicrobiaceae bacterium USS-CC1]|uniref:Uncharacterized protein n=1 Tax=Acidiferrimicrobium australe TaxID=2664430 RepID=A0ABW9QUS2_9ACTN|nr:hypothetical protein [Acidiferrimicrobium australe]